MSPLISVIIPAFNAALFLRDAIESVLAEPHRPLEIIVIDDGSTDQTAEIALSFGDAVICFRQSNMGPAAARNRGLDVAKGDYIAFLDADDVYEPGRLSLQMDKLAANPNVEIVLGRMQQEDLASAPGEPLRFSPLPLGSRIDLQFGVGLYRRSVFDRVGPLNETMRTSEDWDWFMRAREMKIPILVHDDIVMRHRLHRANVTRDAAASLRHLPQLLKRSMDRRRAATGHVEVLPQVTESRETPPPVTEDKIAEDTTHGE